MKIHSTAQLAMFTKAATDTDYAKSRNITSELAQQHLDAHKANGSPDLPERIAASAKSKAASKSNAPVYLESMR